MKQCSSSLCKHINEYYLLHSETSHISAKVKITLGNIHMTYNNILGQEIPSSL